MSNKQLGAWGEALVERVLKRRGHLILMRNWRTKWMEVDLVTKKGNELWVVEVKTRSSAYFGRPEEAVRVHKLLKLKKVVEVIGTQSQYAGVHIRCVIAAVLPEPSPQVTFINLESL